jgi:hypothetical protein
MRKLQIFVDKYGPEVGPKLYHILQSQAGHASVGARLRRKIEAIRERGERPLPLFEGKATRAEAGDAGLGEVSLAAGPLELPASR